MPEAALLSVEHLSVVAEAGARPVLDDVRLQVRRGEVLGIVGESGAGKSTLGLAVMGHVRPGLRRTGGRVLLEGEDLFAIPARALRAIRGARLAYVAQSAAAAFNPAHRLMAQTVEAALFHGLATEAEARGRALGLYDALGLPRPEMLARRFPHQVSGGQLQRVMTAMAMMNAPDLIIFDEPTTALDTTTQARVLLRLKEIVRRTDAAALYITHDLAVVAQMASRICVMRKGRIVEEGPCAAILSAPRHPYTRSLWAVRKAHRQARRGGGKLLEARDLRAGYGRGEDILRGVSLRVPRGRTVALAGESGSGKTTLGRVIAGLLPPRAGSVTLGGRPLPPALRGRDRALKRRIQYVHQSADTSLNPAQTCGEILSRPLRLFHGLKGARLRARIGKLLEMTELDPAMAGRAAADLSGGEKQRLAIARALAAEPELIICDEITSALDAVTRRDILALLARIQEETNVSYLYITHDMATVRAIADHVAVMHNGRIAEAGTRRRMLERPRSPHTRRLLESAPEPEPGWLERFAARRENAGLKRR